jgi:hypothetical protein
LALTPSVKWALYHVGFSRILLNNMGWAYGMCVTWTIMAYHMCALWTIMAYHMCILWTIMAYHMCILWTIVAYHMCILWTIVSLSHRFLRKQLNNKWGLHAKLSCENIMSIFNPWESIDQPLEYCNFLSQLCIASDHLWPLPMGFWEVKTHEYIPGASSMDFPQNTQLVKIQKTTLMGKDLLPFKKKSL